MVSLTDQAVKMVQEEGLSVRKAARKVDVSESAVHAALKKARATVICPCCDTKVEKLLLDQVVLDQLWEIRNGKS